MPGPTSTGSKALFIVAYVTICVSLTLFIVSMLDLGMLSLYLNPCVSMLTMIYLITILVLTRIRRRRFDEPGYYFSTAALCSHLLIVLWFISFVATVTVLSTYKGKHTAASLHKNGLPVTIHTQRFQCFLTLSGTILTLGYAIESHVVSMKAEEEAAMTQPRTAKKVTFALPIDNVEARTSPFAIGEATPTPGLTPPQHTFREPGTPPKLSP
ncbi:hypothetical protein FISHEDRAFT_72745 [Fistulina hepatica ATCC 64428]|nr:hypothetical protein FISHEDRAFT_72745 [Fistulina hepatica ATCC 64428]